MKNHEKIFAEKGNGKGPKTFGIVSQNGMRGGSRGMLASCTAPPPAPNPQIIAHPNKGKMPAANDKKGKCGGGV